MLFTSPVSAKNQVAQFSSYWQRLRLPITLMRWLVPLLLLLVTMPGWASPVEIMDLSSIAPNLLRDTFLSLKPQFEMAVRKIQNSKFGDEGVKNFIDVSVTNNLDEVAERYQKLIDQYWQDRQVRLFLLTGHKELDAKLQAKLSGADFNGTIIYNAHGSPFRVGKYPIKDIVGTVARVIKPTNAPLQKVFFEACNMSKECLRSTVKSLVDEKVPLADDFKIIAATTSLSVNDEKITHVDPYEEEDLAHNIIVEGNLKKIPPNVYVSAGDIGENILLSNLLSDDKTLARLQQHGDYMVVTKDEASRNQPDWSEQLKKDWSAEVDVGFLGTTAKMKAKVGDLFDIGVAYKDTKNFNGEILKYTNQLIKYPVELGTDWKLNPEILWRHADREAIKKLFQFMRENNIKTSDIFINENDPKINDFIPNYQSADRFQNHTYFAKGAYADFILENVGPSLGRVDTNNQLLTPSGDLVKIDNKPITLDFGKWEKPVFTPGNTNASNSSYDKQLIVQLQGDDASYEAARNLFGKHPNKSDWVQWHEGNPTTSNWDGKQLNTRNGLPQNNQGAIRLALIGHGNEDDTKFGGLDSDQLADVSKQAVGSVKKGPITRLRLDLVGTGKFQGNDFKNTLPESLVKTLTGMLKTELKPEQISLIARNAFVRVNAQGKKEYFIAEYDAIGDLIPEKTGWYTKEEAIRSLIKLDLIWDAKTQKYVQKPSQANANAVAVIDKIIADPLGKNLPSPSGCAETRSACISENNYAEIIKQAKEQAKIAQDVQAIQALNDEVFAADPKINQKDSVVVLDKLIADGKGGYSVPVTNVLTGETKNLTVQHSSKLVPAQTALAEFKASFAQLKPLVEPVPGDPRNIRLRAGAHAPEASNGLNTAFGAQALMAYLRDGPGLSPAMQLSTYWNLAGVGVGAAEDIAKLGVAVREVMAPGAAVSKSMTGLTRGLGGLNVVASVGSIGIDSYNLATSTDYVSNVGTGISLGFNVASFGVSSGAWAVGAAFPAVAGTAAGFGYLAGPIAALGYGFSALGMQLAVNREKVHDALGYLVKTDQAYATPVALKEGVWLTDPHAVVSQLDFRSGTVTFGNQRLRSTSDSRNGYTPRPCRSGKNGKSGPDDPDDKACFVDLHEALGSGKAETKFNAAAATELVLPMVPAIVLGYEYQNGGSWAWADGEKATCDKLFASSKKLSCYGGNDAIAKLIPSYEALDIKLLLDQKPRILWFGPLNKAEAKPILDKLSYTFEGKGGIYLLKGVHNGLSQKLSLKEAPNTSTPSTFVLQFSDRTLAYDPALTKNKQALTVLNEGAEGNNVGPFKFTASDSLPTVTLQGTVGTWDIDPKTGNYWLSAIDMRAYPQFDEKHLKIMTTSVKDFTVHTRDLVKVTMGDAPPKPPANLDNKADAESYKSKLIEAAKNATQTVYDSKAHSLISLGTTDAAVQKGSRIVGLTPEHAFFVNEAKKILWRTDRSSNKVDASYALNYLYTEGKETDDHIVAVELVDDKTIRQNVKFNDDYVSLIYALEGDGLKLIGIQPISENLNGKMGLASLEMFVGRLAEASKLETPTKLSKVQHYPTKLAEWVSVATPDNKNRALVNMSLPAQVSLSFDKAAIDLKPIKSWPADQGHAARLLLWSPKQQSAYFVTLSRENNGPYKQDNKQLKTPQIIWAGEREGQAYLVTQDSKLISVDSQGKETVVH
ncbi:TcdA/TcdB pore-forming domain-containing protein [Chitinimonas sp. BJB300]|uniref:TcdA/TcdB pore-forming domain-containing protein n=1 Tax=Chitinimonas sp. BJB300 TaxID=1559339 RepID=UPI000C1014EF|nr:TcdA/TcdB pore-forming domain-containing protein [Chitinimonas sp. BJB300]PHV12893.1 hypothetical protein CSQ89_03120 [Chitinimonas sp. BJB300]TSJ88462.1 hypothetical protein FG002_009790 [Chitinimonas sp. BJB300]